MMEGCVCVLCGCVGVGVYVRGAPVHVEGELMFNYSDIIVNPAYKRRGVASLESSSRSERH